MKPVLSLISAACFAGLSMGAFASEALPPASEAAAVEAVTEAATEAVSVPVFSNQLRASTHELPALAADVPVSAPVVVVVPAAPAEPVATTEPEGPLAALPPWNPEPLPQPERKGKSLNQASRDATNQAATSAFADGISTIGVLSAGGVEMNPIMPSSPIGILMMTAAKMGLANYAENLPDEQRAEMLRSMNATFGGAAVNNLLVLLTAGSPIALVGGLAAGILFWQDTDEKLKAESEAKATHYKALAAAHHRETMALWHAVKVEAHEVNDGDIEVQPLGTLDTPDAAALKAMDIAQPATGLPRTVQVAQAAREAGAAAAAGQPRQVILAPALPMAPPVQPAAAPL